jgi:hypothetical protein
MAIAGVRMTKPLHGGLAAQFQTQQAVAKLENERHPTWIAQTDSGFDPAFHLFTETNVMPIHAYRALKAPSVCDLPLRKNENYVIVTENENAEADVPKWRCTSPSAVPGIPKEIRATLEICPASELRCGK